MSAASRARESERRQLYHRRGFPTWEAYQAWQRDQLARLNGPWQPLTWTPGRLDRPLMWGERLASVDPSGTLPYQLDLPVTSLYPDPS